MVSRMIFFPIGGLVDIGKTPIAAILRYLRELAGSSLATGYPMFPCAILDGYKDHEPIKIDCMLLTSFGTIVVTVTGNMLYSWGLNLRKD